ncbi:MAG: dihydrofolate reductase [Chloroflexales bacterium]|nr:dihydrofolate reductase [Chloroflexales bacterium]
MRKIVVLMHLTLDGVMQAPGRPDEDVRGGFPHGGWARPRGDAMGAVDTGIAPDGALLLGRRTYEDFFAFWPNQTDNPFTARLNAMQKYVASTTLQEPLPWHNSTLLAGDAAEAVSRLKAEPGPDLLIMGSGVLVQALMRHNLIDRYMLLIHPLVLGTGRRLFEAGSPTTELRLVDSSTTTSGVISATYHLAEPTAPATA